MSDRVIILENHCITARVVCIYPVSNVMACLSQTKITVVTVVGNSGSRPTLI